jgi:hypothetical protein
MMRSRDDASWKRWVKYTVDNVLLQTRSVSHADGTAALVLSRVMWIWEGFHRFDGQDVTLGGVTVRLFGTGRASKPGETAIPRNSGSSEKTHTQFLG